MKLKTTKNNLLKYIKTPFDGQDYETVAHLIAGNHHNLRSYFFESFCIRCRGPNCIGL